MTDTATSPDDPADCSAQSAPSREFESTVDWFEAARPLWDQIVPRLAASRVLEVGCYEGASACYLIQVLGEKAPLEIHCIDHWQGDAERRAAGVDMDEVAARFQRNVSRAVAASRHPVDLHVHRGSSEHCLADLLCRQPRPAFDFIYIDGSHQAADVLLDAAMAFRLLRRGGIMILDDYLWSDEPWESRDLTACPKMAIDAFINCNIRKLRLLPVPLNQVCLQKMAE